MQTEPPNDRPSRRSLPIRVLALGVRFVLPLVVLAAGGWAAKHMMETGPTAQRKPAQRRARLVEVIRTRRSDATTTIHAMGTVRPAREVVLKPRVAGEILEVAPHFVPGARIRKDDWILKLDPQDYELVVRQRESECAKARADLRLEEGNQIVARRESELLGSDVKEEDRGLLLRKPQLEIAKAALESAEAAADDARLDVARTMIRAPFNAVVRKRMVDLGAYVTPGSELVELAGTDEYWVEVSVPVDQLRWIEIPTTSEERGAPVRVTDESAWGAGESRTGRVLFLASGVEAEGRMARLLVSVPDPLGLRDGAPAMLLDAYVRVTIEGRKLENVVALDRRFVRDGDSVWIMNAASKLEIRKIGIVFGEKDLVYVSAGIEEGDRLVVSDLSSAVEGMPLRTAADPDDPQAPPASASTDAPGAGAGER